MPLTLITGTYRVVGASPDGDSVRFYPHDPQAFRRAGITVKANRAGGVQLRLDAIDALETHYTPPHGSREWDQRGEFGPGGKPTWGPAGRAALDRVLSGGLL